MSSSIDSTLHLMLLSKNYKSTSIIAQAYLFFKAARIIDPHQMPSLPKDISRFSTIHGLNSPSPRLLSEWAIYRSIKQHELPDPFVLQEFWEGMKIRLPLLAEIALSVLQRVVQKLKEV